MSSDCLYEARVEDLLVSVYQSDRQLGQAAAEEAAAVIRAAVDARGASNIMLATGNSQLAFLAALRRLPGIAWSSVSVFHLDEYVGISPQHPASFRNYLHRYLIDHVNPRAFHPISAQRQDLAEACRDYEKLLVSNPVDLCALGIGENGHLAFNDPPVADFDDPARVKVVALAEASRRQQVTEGHFRSLEEVPKLAITLTIPALLAAERIVAVVPESRKANAVHCALTGHISEDCPSSVLRRAAHAHLLLDLESAALVSRMLKGG